MRAQRGIGIWPCVVVAASGPACNAKITRFDAVPRHVCSGDRVDLSWSFDGTGIMTVSPAVPHAPTGRVASQGTATIYPVAPTAVELRVTRFAGRPAGARIDIELSHGELVAASIGDPSASCQNGVVASTAHVRNFGVDITVTEIGVQPGDPRSYDVSHLDPQTQQVVTARVSTAAPTTVFAGQPIAGDWQLSSALPPGVSCDSLDLPGNLVVVAYTQCRTGGSP
ncbi:MAG TPA: hypothetical protein VHW23_14080 [Kofleriaceae bacterium]|nr:hypothetical protein [Kofleriaceae bacterium]